jgi:uncharacterized protein YjiS (DUF1127 family)
MSIASTHLPVPAAAHAAPAALARSVRAAIAWIGRRYAARVQRRILHSLSDHILRDIGLDPSEIDAIVDERLGRSARPNGFHWV